MQRENKQLLVVTHLSQLLDFVTGTYCTVGHLANPKG